PSRVRRSGGEDSAARPASGAGERAGREPTSRPRASKPAVRATDPSRWTPRHALAPGLHLVATPIGNLGDITLRALWVLRSVDRILCEDTRVTGRLLARYGISAPLDPYHDHNADRVRPQVLDRLRRGERLALVSDAGMPLVSDPGYRLVREAIAAGLPVTAAPGPSAALTALVLSGLPPDAFVFGGFLPPRPAARRRAAAAWKEAPASLIFFEGPSRPAASLADLAAVLGPRDAAVVREATKRHEKVARGTLPALAARYRAAPAPDELDRRLREALARSSLRDAVAEVAAAAGLARAAVYRRALALRGGRA